MYSPASALRTVEVTRLPFVDANSFGEKAFSPAETYTCVIEDVTNTVRSSGGTEIVIQSKLYLPPIEASVHDEYVIDGVAQSVQKQSRTYNHRSGKCIGLVVYL